MKALTQKQLTGGLCAASYLLAMLYMESAFFARYGTKGWCWFAFVLCFFVGGEVFARLWYAAQSLAQQKPCKESNFWLGCGLLLGVVYSIGVQGQYYPDRLFGWAGANDLVLVYACLALHGIAAYWVLCRFGWLSKGETSARVVVDGANALFFLPFGSFFQRFTLFWSAGKALLQRKLSHTIARKSAIATAISLCVFGVFFAVALSLLRSSDVVFAEFLEGFTFSVSLPIEVVNWGVRFLLALPVGAYFFGLFYRCAQARQTPTALEQEVEAVLKHREVLRVVSVPVLRAVLLAFVALYLLYFGVQIEFYLSAFWGELPEHFTFSEYARQGFFELCKLMTLNFALLWVVAKLSVVPLRQTTGLRYMAFALLGTSLLFAATAFAKLVLYIQAYGFTELRLLSAWAITMLVIAVCLAVQSIRSTKSVAKNLIYSAVLSFIFIVAVVV